MNKWKLPAAILIVLLASCSRYQYVFLGSNLEKNNQKEYFQENDTLSVSYSFHGPNCPLKIKVYNKLSTPVYIDQKKSAVIVFEDSYSMWDGEISTSGEHITLVPPLSSIEIQPFNMLNEFIEIPENTKPERAKFLMANGEVTVKRYRYNIHNTPYYFRCFLVWSPEKSFVQEYFSDNEFWVSDIIPTFSQIPAQPNNFYIQKSTAFSTVLGVTALAGILYLAALVPETPE